MENIVETNINSNETNTYSIYPVFWSNEYMGEIEYIYQMYKDQEGRIFSLDAYQDGSLMDLIQEMIEQDLVFVVVNSTGEVMANFILSDVYKYKDIIIEAHVHCAVRRKFWGKEARRICREFRKFVESNFKIKKVIAEVPQCKYGVIKLIKDMGMVHEGTIKECMLYNDKKGQPKWYDKLIYTITRKDI